MFDYEGIYAAIGPEHVPVADPDIDLPEMDQGLRLGVGRDGQRAFIFVGPGQATARTLEGRQFRFDPWRELIDRGSGVVLKDVCVLRFRTADEVEVRDAVAAVFAGLVDLARSTPTVLGDAIEAMEGLFESGLRSGLSRGHRDRARRRTVGDRGVRETLVSRQHLALEGGGQVRLQRTRRTPRGEDDHRLRARALVRIGTGGAHTWRLHELRFRDSANRRGRVHRGLPLRCSSGLTLEEKARVRAIIIETAKEPPEVIASVVFDRDAARASLLHVASDGVPVPIKVPGIGRMRWEATLAPDVRGPGASCGFVASLGY